MQNEVNNMITNEREWVKIPLLSNKVGKRSGTDNRVTTVRFTILKIFLSKSLTTYFCII